MQGLLLQTCLNDAALLCVTHINQKIHNTFFCDFFIVCFPLIQLNYFAIHSSSWGIAQVGYYLTNTKHIVWEFCGFSILLIHKDIKITAFLEELTPRLHDLLWTLQLGFPIFSLYKIHKHLQFLMSTLCPLKEISMCLKYCCRRKSMGIFGLEGAVCAFCRK